MNFRKVKYIQFVIGLVLFAIGTFLYAREEKLSFILLGVLLSIDFITRLILKIYSNKLISSGELVKIRQKEYRFWNTVDVIGTVLIIALFIHFLLNKDFFPDKSVVLILYVGTVSQLFFERRGDFYIDREGFIQPEILKNNYYWSEIQGFKLDENRMFFAINSKEYSVEVTDEVKAKLTNLI